MNLNRIELIGFLGSEPGTTYTPNGKAVATLSLATRALWMNDDERQERTEWHRIQAWAKLAEYAGGFKKGAHVRVEGELRSREYIRDGRRRQSPHLRDRRFLDHESPPRSAHFQFGA
jgi:single-strand DNA-binding protein